MGNLCRWIERERSYRRLKTDRTPIVDKIECVDTSEPGCRIIPRGRGVARQYTVLVATEIRHTIWATRHARHCDRSSRNIVENARPPQGARGITTGVCLSCQRIENVVRVSLAGLRLLIDQCHDSRECRSRARRTTDGRKGSYLTVTPEINVRLANKIEARVQTIPCK